MIFGLRFVGVVGVRRVCRIFLFSDMFSFFEGGRFFIVEVEVSSLYSFVLSLEKV